MNAMFDPQPLLLAQANPCAIIHVCIYHCETRSGLANEYAAVTFEWCEA